ncbi:MAG: histidinol-phosphate transaminase [Burkholderiaceae bacterium]|nr:histidinol-phosphate transaminase [Burkholderiaceae bacterium]
MSEFWSKVVRGLSPYTPGEQPKIDGLIKLNTNENPYPPSAKAYSAIQAISADSLRLYPDPESTDLCRAIGTACGVPADHVFVGNGSDEVLAFVFQGLLASRPTVMGQHDGPLVFPDITYSFYPTYCGLYGVDYQLVPLESDFSLDLNRIPESARAVIFPNPNAPTGRGLARDAIEAFATARPNRLVVVDEAYVDFGAESCVPLTLHHKNILVTQSFSKSRALAGLRVGFAIGHPELLDALNRIKNSFNSYPIDRLAAAGAAASILDTEWFEANRGKVMKSRATLVAGLEALGFEVVPSQANFVFTRHPKVEGAMLAQQLRERKILVRHFAKPRIDQYLRITVGTDAQVAALIEALGDIVR